MNLYKKKEEEEKKMLCLSSHRFLGKKMRALFFQTSCLTELPTRRARTLSDRWCNISLLGVLLEAKVIFCSSVPPLKLKTFFSCTDLCEMVQSSVLVSPSDVRSGETDKRSQLEPIRVFPGKIRVPSMCLFSY